MTSIYVPILGQNLSVPRPVATQAPAAGVLVLSSDPAVSFGFPGIVPVSLRGWQSFHHNFPEPDYEGRRARPTTIPTVVVVTPQSFLNKTSRIVAAHFSDEAFEGRKLKPSQQAQAPSLVAKPFYNRLALTISEHFFDEMFGGRKAQPAAQAGQPVSNIPLAFTNRLAYVISTQFSEEPFAGRKLAPSARAGQPATSSQLSIANRLPQIIAAHFAEELFGGRKGQMFGLAPAGVVPSLPLPLAPGRQQRAFANFFEAEPYAGYPHLSFTHLTGPRVLVGFPIISVFIS